MFEAAKYWSTKIGQLAINAILVWNGWTATEQILRVTSLSLGIVLSLFLIYKVILDLRIRKKELKK